MNIKTLRVQNFKNFEDKTFEFSQGFNLIIGDNGTGKTTLLEALGVLMREFIQAVDPTFLSGTRKFNTYVRMLSIMKGEVINFERQYPCHVEMTFAFMGNQYSEIKTLSDSILDFTQSDLEWIAKTYAHKIRSGESETAPVIAFYSTARLWLEKIEATEESNQMSLFDDEVVKPSSRLDGYRNALDVAISNKSWLRWFMRMELISLQENKQIKVFEAVKRAVQACLEGCDLLNFRIQRGEPVARINGITLPFSLLSDGQRSMMAMVADIAYRMAQLNPHLLENVTLETPGVVLIDELDLHLHPKWQRKVVDNLRKAFPKVQFFATTHSPFIVQSLSDTELLIDLNENAGITEFQNKSIEDIAEEVMDVENPQLSQHKQEELRVAREYFSMLEKAKNAEGAELEQFKLELDRLKTELDKVSWRFSDNMAYHAFLEFKRAAALKE